MCRHRHQVRLGGRAGHIDPRHRLDGVRVQRGVRGQLADQVGDRAERLDRADLVVHEHHRDDHRVAVERVGEGVQIDDPRPIHTDGANREALLAQPLSRRQDPLVLERGGDDAVTSPRRPTSPGDARNPEVVGFGAATGEHHLPRLGPQRRRDLLPGLLQRRLGGLRRSVDPGRVREASCEVRPHRRDGLRPHRRARRVVQVRRSHATSVRAHPAGASGWPASQPGMTVTPFGDTFGVSTQLRLVESPARTHRAATAKRGRPSGRRARVRARWDVDWRLDATTRQTGRVGVAAARDALNRAAEQDLRQAS